MSLERGGVVVTVGAGGRGRGGEGRVVDEGLDGVEDRELERFADLEGVGVGECDCAGFGGRRFGAGTGWRGEGDEVGGGSGSGGGGGRVEGGGLVGGFFEDRFGGHGGGGGWSSYM